MGRFNFFYLYSPEVRLNNLVLKFFEPGHISCADQFHHQVEQSLKKKIKVYDLLTSKVAYKLQILEEFMYSPKIKNPNLVYLQDMVLISFERGDSKLKYKTSFKGNAVDIDFLMVKFSKTTMPQLWSRNHSGAKGKLVLKVAPNSHLQ